MGNEQSTLAVIRSNLSMVLPPYNRKEGLYHDEKDREQFIGGLLIVLTNNSTLELKDHHFALLYSRRFDREDRIVARVVASRDGVIRAKVEAGGFQLGGRDGSGRDQAEAFRELRKYIEVRLDEILAGIPEHGQGLGVQQEGESGSAALGLAGRGAGEESVPGTVDGMSVGTLGSAGGDAPPAYGSEVKRP